PQEAPWALQAVRARGDEVPREASGRSLPGCVRAARRSRGGGRQAAQRVVGALAGVVVRLTESRGTGAESTPTGRAPPPPVRFPFPVSRFPKALPPPPPAAALHTVSGMAVLRVECRSPRRRLRSPAPRRRAKRDQSHPSAAATFPVSRFPHPDNTRRRS